MNVPSRPLWDFCCEEGQMPTDLVHSRWLTYSLMLEILGSLFAFDTSWIVKTPFYTVLVCLWVSYMCHHQLRLLVLHCDFKDSKRWPAHGSFSVYTFSRRAQTHRPRIGCRWMEDVFYLSMELHVCNSLLFDPRTTRLSYELEIAAQQTQMMKPWNIFQLV